VKLFVNCFALIASASLVSAAEAAKPITGVDRAYIDPAISPCKDFYDYANGAFNSFPIPGAYSNWGVNQEIDERNFIILKDILETSAKTGGPAGSIAQRVGDFYFAGMDEAAIEKAGISPLQSRLDAIAAIKTAADLQAIVAQRNAEGLSTCFRFGVGVDEKDTTAMTASFYQGGLGLPDRDFYFRTDEKSTEIRQAYVAHVARTLELAGDAPAVAKANADAILALETKLAKASRTLVERRDPEKNYNKLDHAALAKQAPGIAWDGFFASIKLPSTEKTVVVGQPEYFTALGGLFQTETLDTWRAYLRWHLLRQTSDYLSRAFVDEHFSFYGRKLSGTTELKPRWKRVLAEADDAIGEDLGQLYVKQAFSEEAKARALEMIKFHLQAMHNRIEAATWMSETTKTQAYRKLSTMRSKIGYPDRWRDYSALHLDRSSYVGNAIAAGAFEFQRNLAKLGKPVDRTDWFMTPQTNNAYYDPTLNEMCFPAGILQPPFFDANADDATNYGALASTIGHELTHGFDDEGRQYDADGNLKNWWTDADAAGFKERAEIVAKQYDAYEPLPGLRIDGEQTLGENIADIGGLRVAYEAFKLATANKRLMPVDGFTPDQRFFIAFAQGWRTNQRPEAVRTRLTSDVHSPVHWRVIGPVANLPEFYEAFGCPQPKETWSPIW
jgi:putative endopeptidase